MKLVFTRSFLKDCRALPSELQNATDKKLKLLMMDPHHRSLHPKKMQDPRKNWEGRITKGYRFAFQLEGELCDLRRRELTIFSGNPEKGRTALLKGVFPFDL